MLCLDGEAIDLSICMIASRYLQIFVVMNNAMGLGEKKKLVGVEY